MPSSPRDSARDGRAWTTPPHIKRAPRFDLAPTLRRAAPRRGFAGIAPAREHSSGAGFLDGEEGLAASAVDGRLADNSSLRRPLQNLNEPRPVAAVRGERCAQ